MDLTPSLVANGTRANPFGSQFPHLQNGNTTALWGGKGINGNDGLKTSAQCLTQADVPFCEG